MRVEAMALRRRMHHLADAFDIAFQTSIVRDDVAHALCKASAHAPLRRLVPNQSNQCRDDSVPPDQASASY